MRLPLVLSAAVLFAGCCAAPQTFAADGAPAIPPAAAKPSRAADEAAVKIAKDGQPDQRFLTMHESFLKRGKEGPIGVLFLGDSITEGWGKAKGVWEAHYGAHQPANFGISGDRTQHVLWRLDHGELDGIAPQVVVLMIGTNNLGSNPAEEIAAADARIVAELHAKLPQTRVLLLAVFPRGADPKNPAVAQQREAIAKINQVLAKLDDGAKTRYLDLGPKFLDADGTLPKDVMPDALHPDIKGYTIWAEAMQPLLDEMLK